MGGNVFHIQVLFEIMHVLLHVAKFNGLLFSFAPIWIQNEPVFRRQISEFWQGRFLFSQDYLTYKQVQFITKGFPNERITMLRLVNFERSLPVSVNINPYIYILVRKCY